MKKQIQTLIEIGIIYLAASIVLESLLSGYPIIMLPLLGVTFIFFATMIFGTLWQPRVTEVTNKMERTSGKNDDLTRLEHLCAFAIGQGDAGAATQVSDRVRALAFAAAAYRLKTSLQALRSMSKEHLDKLATSIGDQQMLKILTSSGSFVRKGDSSVLEEYLTTIEGWTS